jgi:hypothetical protein
VKDIALMNVLDSVHHAWIAAEGESLVH